MSLTVENGTIVTGANSFVSLAEANTYFESELYATRWDGATDATKEKALKMATRYVGQNYTWKGELVSPTQPLYFPRTDVIDLETGLEYAANAIPLRFKQAICEMALFLLTNDLNSLKTQGKGIKREKADVVEVEYFESQTTYISFSPVAETLLSEFGSPKGNYVKEAQRC